jgi:hypothetical protein
MFPGKRAAVQRAPGGRAGRYPPTERTLYPALGAAYAFSLRTAVPIAKQPTNL